METLREGVHENGTIVVDLDRLGVPIGLVKIGGDVIHPIVEAVQCRTRKADKQQALWLMFKLDSLVVDIANREIDVVQRLTKEIILEPVAKSELVMVEADAECQDVVNEVFAKYRVSMGNMQGLEDSQQILARFFELYPGFDESILVYTSEAGYVGQVVESDESFTTFFSPKLDPVNQNLTTSHLESMFYDYGTVPYNCSAKAWYELFGSFMDPECKNNVSLFVEWKPQRNAPIRVLGPPSLLPERAFLVVHGSPIFLLRDSQMSYEPRQEEAFMPDLSLHVLYRLIKSSENPASSESECSGWEDLIKRFIRSSSHGSIIGLSGQEDGEDHQNSRSSSDSVSKDDFEKTQVEHLRFRSNLDFSEHFWEEVVKRSPNNRALVMAVKMLVKALVSGDLLPYIHKTNDTAIGKLCKQAVQHHLDKDDNANSGFKSYIEAMAKYDDQKLEKLVTEHLVQLGIWKLGRDFDHWFNEVGVEKNEFKLLNPKEGKEDRLLQLQHLRNALQVAWTALNLRCPREETKQLVMKCLHHFHDNEYENPTFILPIKSQLPWVRDDASGIMPLPTPYYWQISQRDKIGKFTQTVRLAPYSTHRKRPDFQVLEKNVHRAIERLQDQRLSSTHDIRTILLRDSGTDLPNPAMDDENQRSAETSATTTTTNNNMEIDILQTNFISIK